MTCSATSWPNRTRGWLGLSWWEEAPGLCGELEVMGWGGGAAVGPQGAMDMGVMGTEDMGFF